MRKLTGLVKQGTHGWIIKLKRCSAQWLVPYLQGGYKQTCRGLLVPRLFYVFIGDL